MRDTHRLPSHVRAIRHVMESTPDTKAIYPS